MSGYLRPTAPIAPAALLPGDPGRAMALATSLLEAPLMSNHHRGLWGYFGETEAGRPLTVQSTGIGGPSSVVVLRDLVALGVEKAIRIGTCRALDPELELGQLLVVEHAVALDGTSAALGCSGSLETDPALTTTVLLACPQARAATVASVDLMPLIGEPGPRVEAASVDLTTSPLLALAGQLGLALAALLVVGENTRGELISDELLEQVSLTGAEAAVAALSATTRSSS